MMKILGSDYDGTLTVGGITERKIEAVNNWRACRNRFGIIIGRNNELRQSLNNNAPRLEVNFFVL